MTDVDDEVVSLVEAIDKLNARLDSLCKDVAFIKEKSDQIGVKVYWIDRKLDQLIKDKGV